MGKNEDADLLIRVAIWLLWSQNLKFWLLLNTFGFFWKSKNKTKVGFFWLFFSRKGLALAKHCLSCIFITNLFWRESMTMQGTN